MNGKKVLSGVNDIDESIVWRYVSDDESGKLIWSANSICSKQFDYKLEGQDDNGYITAIKGNNWNTSTIRKWLNSSNNVETMGAVSRDDLENVVEAEREKGFLHSDNFSLREKNAIKTVVLKNIVDNLDLKDKSKAVNRETLANYLFYTSVADEDLQKEFECYPSEKFIESIFFLDYVQLTEIEENKSILYTDDDLDKIGRFWLKTPFIGMYYGQGGDTYAGADVFYGYIKSKTKSFIIGFSYGTIDREIRPAFYLNEENAQILSGSGTKEDPYVVDGRDIPERFEENGLYGYKDRDGNVVIEAKYSKALPFSDGAALVATTEDPYRWRYIDTDGNYLFDKAFYASNNFNNGYALVLVSDGPTYRYIDKTGEWANDLIFEDAEDFDGGYARVKMNGKWGIVDTMFNFTVSCDFETKEEASAHFGRPTSKEWW